MFSVCAVIPVYDHEGAIGAVVQSLRAQALPVLLVDDGCGPTCAGELERLSALPGVFLLRHDKNRGKGAAVCTGMRAAAQRNFTHALQIDADGQHDLRDVQRFVELAREFPGSLICGRPLFDATMPRSRFYGRHLTHGMVWLETLSFDIVDSMCGFRVYPLAPTLDVLDASVLGSRMDFDVEILVRLHWRNVPMRWIDTRVRYPLDGVSHFRLFFDNVLMTSLHVRLLLGMLIRVPMLLWRKLAHRDGARHAHKRNANA